MLPEFDLQHLENPVLTFRSSVHFADASTLSLWVTEGMPDVNTAEWFPVDTRIANRGDDAEDWIESGPIFLSDFPNGFRLGFRYEGSGRTSNDGTYELDDFFLANQPQE